MRNPANAAGTGGLNPNRPSSSPTSLTSRRLCELPKPATRCRGEALAGSRPSRSRARPCSGRRPAPKPAFSFPESKSSLARDASGSSPQSAASGPPSFLRAGRRLPHLIGSIGLTSARARLLVVGRALCDAPSPCQARRPSHFVNQSRFLLSAVDQELRAAGVPLPRPAPAPCSRRPRPIAPQAYVLRP